MIENGFFCLWPDAETSAKLEQYCKEPHISVLVIDDAKEIAHMKQLTGHRLEGQSIRVIVVGTHTLHTRAGLAIPVLQITQDECKQRKHLYSDVFSLTSDVYGISQEFHISLDSPTDDLIGEVLTFDKCTFSTRMINTKRS